MKNFSLENIQLIEIKIPIKKISYKYINNIYILNENLFYSIKEK